MEIIVLCAIYVVELIWFQLGLKTLFNVKQKFKKWMIFGIIYPIVIGYLPVDSSGKNVLITLFVMGMMFLSLKGKVVDKVIKIALVLIFLSCLDEIFLYICEQIYHLDKMIDIKYNVEYFITKCCTSTCLLILLYIIKSTRITKTIHISSFIYLIIGIIAVCMMFCLAVLNYAKQYFLDIRFIIVCNFLFVAVYISIFLLVTFVIYIKNTHERMERLLKTEQLLKETQVSHYRQLLKKEEDTRNYRHDMNNHLIYLQELLSRNKIEDARNYLEQIQGNFRNIQKTYYVTGNEMIDAIMNYFFGMLPDTVTVKIIGKCPVEFDIEDTDICTIFSNLFQNVVEEIISNQILHAKIEIRLEKGKDYIKYQIKNTLHQEIKLNKRNHNDLPVTSKKDKRNHGIGLTNVRMAVERNRGTFAWNQSDGYFSVNVILPMKDSRLRSEPTA